MSLLAPGEFGHPPYKPSCSKSASVLTAECLGLQAVMGAARRVEILCVLLKKGQFFLLKTRT